MEAATRIALLLFGLGVGDVLAEEPAPEADPGRDSPIFVVRTLAPPPPPLPARRPADARTPVERRLASLLRSEIGTVSLTAPGVETTSSDAESTGPTLHLEKMTVTAPRLSSPPPRETGLEKFIRTGHLWEFSPTKRFMIGPKGDKVGLMFSFDW